MTVFTVKPTVGGFIAEFDGCIGKGKKEFEAIENAHEAARLKRIEERIQKAFERGFEIDGT